MRSVIATHQSRRNAKKSTGVTKLTGNDPQRPNRALRSLDDYFWYTSSDGVYRLAISSGTPNEVPQQVNDYVFDSSRFADAEYPSTFPEDRVWPPVLLRDLLCAIGSEGEDCVGERCFTNTICGDPRCGHTFESWKQATQDWQEHFELRKTGDRGIGVYTKKKFKKGDVLGWYAGELVARPSCHWKNDYLMEMPVGSAPISENLSDSDSNDDDSQDGLPTPPPSSSGSSTISVEAEESIMIDGSRKGNWTRFINHSCEPHCEFRMRRVGNIRIMAVEAIRNVPAGVELTVSYGLDYYGPTTRKICYCVAKNCISRLRKKRQGGLWSQEKRRVKKCRRLTPPPE